MVAMFGACQAGHYDLSRELPGADGDTASREEPRREVSSLTSSGGLSQNVSEVVHAEEGGGCERRHTGRRDLGGNKQQCNDSQLPALSTGESIDRFFHTIRGFASRETACPGYPHVLPPPPRGVTGGWQSVGIESGRTVHCMGRSRRRTSSRAVFPCLSFRETCASSVPGHGFPPDIAMTALAPSRGRGLPERNVRVPSPMAIVTTVHCPGEEGRERTSF
jgi:hypothetical protein